MSFTDIHQTAFIVARLKVDGEEIKRSPGTADQTLARRKLSALKDELRQIESIERQCAFPKCARAKIILARRSDFRRSIACSRADFAIWSGVVVSGKGACSELQVEPRRSPRNGIRMGTNQRRRLTAFWLIP